VFRNSDGGPLDPDNLDRTFTRHLTLAGLPAVRFHDTRHTLMPSAFQGVGERLDALLQGTDRAQTAKSESETSARRGLKPASRLALRLVGPAGFEPATT
jgi:integrase